jgi:hypothetical protein
MFKSLDKMKRLLKDSEKPPVIANVRVGEWGREIEERFI